MKKINISTKKYPNTFVLVDDENYEFLIQFKWHRNKKGHAERSKTKKYSAIKMHRLIMNCPDHLQVDHINGNKLDNRKSNLRLCTNQQNVFNMGANKRGLSRYKGVTRSVSPKKKWVARISKDGKMINLGTFYDEKEAAWAYNCAARILFGEFARENIL